MAFIEIHSPSKLGGGKLGARESKFGVADVGIEVGEKALILEASGGTSDEGIWVGNRDGRRRGRWVCGGRKRVVSFSVVTHDLI